MRVLHVIAEMGVGGAEAVVGALADDALVRGDEVAVASSGGWRADDLAARGARLVELPLRGRGPYSLLRATLTLRSELRAAPPDVVHVHNVKAAGVLRLARGRARGSAPVLATLHGVPDALIGVSARLLSRCADRVIAVSPDLRARLVAAGCSAGSTDVVENAVRPVPLIDRAVARAELDVGLDVPVALCLARLAAPKRHDLLLAAWHDVRPDAVLLVAGDGPNRASVESAAAALGGRVRVLGARTDVGTLLSAADLLVLPSDSEGLPISVLEALAAGVPAVVSAVGGLAVALRGAVVLVEPGSAVALAEGVESVLADLALRDDLVGAGHRVIEERFGLDRMLAEYRASYDLLTRGRSS